MRSKTLRAGFAAFALAVGAFALMASQEAGAADTAKAFVETSIDKGSAILSDGSLDTGQRQNQFRGFLLSITDTRRVGLFTLGSYARGASEPDIAVFVTAFTDFVTALYQRSLDRANGQTIRVTGSTEHSEDDTIVKADVLDPNGKSPPMKIGFRVRTNDRGNYVLTDLQIEGVWLAMSQLSDFTAYLQQHHGEIGQLSKELEKRAAQIHAGRLANTRQS
jgi:phospholipid transport system substrate-binding protein